MNKKIIPLKVNSNFFFERAVRCLDKMNYKGAIKYFRRAVEHDPGNALNHCNLAGVLSETGEYKESNKILFHVISRIDTAAYECYYYIANNYANMGDYDRAAIYADKYLEADRDGEFAQDAEELLEFFGEADKQISNNDVARRLLEEGNFQEASKELLKMLEDDPDYQVARNNLALTYFYTGNTEEAIKESERVLETDPHNIYAHCNLAVFYFEQERHLDYLQELEYLRKVTPFHDDHVYKLALTLGMLGDHEQAYRHFRRLLKRDSFDDYQVFFMTGVAAANSGRLSAALQYWKRAQKIDGSSEIPRFYIELAETALKNEQELDTIGYFYNLPFEEQLRKIELSVEKGITTEIFKDPVVKLSLYWALKNSDDKTKFNVIRLLSLVFDGEIRREFEQFLLSPDENDDLKKIILILFHQAGIKGPYEVFLKKKKVDISETQVGKMYIAWRPEWVQVLEIVIERMAAQENDSTIYIADLEAIWIDFLSKQGERLPKRFKADGWAAALEYAVYRLHHQKITQKDIADKYQISISTLSSKYNELLHVCERLRSKRQ